MISVGGSLRRGGGCGPLGTRSEDLFTCVLMLMSLLTSKYTKQHVCATPVLCTEDLHSIEDKVRESSWKTRRCGRRWGRATRRCPAGRRLRRRRSAGLMTPILWPDRPDWKRIPHLPRWPAARSPPATPVGWKITLHHFWRSSRPRRHWE